MRATACLFVLPALLLPATAIADTVTIATPGMLVPGLTIDYPYGSSTRGNFYLGEFTITADPGVTFDLLSGQIVYSHVTGLYTDVADVPEGIDPSTPEGYAALWQAALTNTDIWQGRPGPETQFTMRGYLDSMLVAEVSPSILPTDLYLKTLDDLTGTTHQDPDPRAFEGLPLTGLDRLEITYPDEALQTTGFAGAVLLGDAWYTNDYLDFVFDDLVLDVTYSATNPDPGPVPLPIGGALLLGALGLMRLRF